MTELKTFLQSVLVITLITLVARLMAGCGPLQASQGTSIESRVANDGRQCYVLTYNGDPRGVSCP